MIDHVLDVGEFSLWLLKSEWSEDFQDYIAEFAEEFEEHFERSYAEAVRSIGTGDHAILLVALAQDYLELTGLSLVNSLKKSVPDFPAESLSILRAIVKATGSIFEVVEAKPGSHYVLQDHVRGGAPIRLTTPDTELDLCQWDIVFGRVVKVRGQYLLTPGFSCIPRDYWPDIQAAIQSAEATLRKENLPLSLAERHNLLAGEIERNVRMLWLEYRAGLSEAQPPQLVNSEGDAIELVSMGFPIKGTLEQVATALSNAPDFEENDPTHWAWIQNFKGSPIVFAFLSLESNRLLAECNSGKRAKKLTARLQALLGARIGKPLKMKTSIKQEMSMPREAPAPLLQDTLDPVASEELEAALRQNVLEHYLKQLDEVVPMLGGRPREVVRSAMGRAEVINWLKHIENRQEREGVFGLRSCPDLTPVWEELGILAYRGASKSLFD